MAAINPSAEPEYTGTVNGDGPVRATLKLIRQPFDPEDEEDYLNVLPNGEDSEDEDESSSDEEKNGGPSDPSKSLKARQRHEAAVKQLKASLDEEDSDDEIEVNGVNGIADDLLKPNKGKAKATGDESEDNEDDSEDIETEEFVLCTLDPSKV